LWLKNAIRRPEHRGGGSCFSDTFFKKKTPCVELSFGDFCQVDAFVRSVLAVPSAA
jgi:hypothetical protein